MELLIQILFLIAGALFIIVGKKQNNKILKYCGTALICVSLIWAAVYGANELGKGFGEGLISPK